MTKCGEEQTSAALPLGVCSSFRTQEYGQINTILSYNEERPQVLGITLFADPSCELSVYSHELEAGCTQQNGFTFTKTSSLPTQPTTSVNGILQTM